MWWGYFGIGERGREVCGEKRGGFGGGVEGLAGGCAWLDGRFGLEMW